MPAFSSVPGEPAQAPDAAALERICEARDLLLKKLSVSGDPNLASALEDMAVSAGELVLNRRLRAYDSTGDAKLSSIYLDPRRFNGASPLELASEIERLLRQALAENRIPDRAQRIRSIQDSLNPPACTNCGARLHVLRIFSETSLRYDCGMCRRCNEVLCPVCYPGHLHKFKIQETCAKCGGTGFFSQLVPKPQSFFRKMLEGRPEHDLVAHPCAACEGRGYRES